MNSILAICSEYSDNVWYSGLGVDSTPEKIAIEIEKGYKNAFLKTIRIYGYKLESSRKGDDLVNILTLIKIKKKILC
jgi:hypothetical protein